MIIDTNKEHSVYNFDSPGAYLHVEMPRYKKILMMIRRDFVDIMCQVNTEYKQHVRYENWKRCYTS